MDEFALACRYILATTFFLAGLSKISNHRAFAQVISRYNLLPERYSPAVATWLPRFEILSAVLLGAGVLVSLAATALLVALVVFTAAVTINLVRGQSMDCGCFGSTAGRTITWFSVLRNLLLIAIAIVAVRSPYINLSLAGRGEPASVTSDASAVAVAMMGITSVLLALLLTEIVRITRASRSIAKWR